MITFPGCKINLGLYITERRPDGYHNLETCFYPVPWNDILEAVPAEAYNLDVTGTVVAPGNDNLVTKAYLLLKEKFNIKPVKVHLHKCLPNGAGLGGGSSDGATMLILLNKIYQLGINNEELEKLALQLGSDCPFFIKPSPKIATGKGEIFTDVKCNLKGLHLLIVKPPQSISTAEAYKHAKFKSPDYPLKKILEEYPIEAWNELLFNSFENYVFHQIPTMEEIRLSLRQKGAAFSMMSGSGSAIFGIFREKPDKTGFPADCTVWQGELN